MTRGINQFVEGLENRQLLSAAHSAVELALAPFQTIADKAVTAHKTVAKAAKRESAAAETGPTNPALLTTALSTAQVTQILGDAGSQAMATQAIAVVDHQGTLLGLYVGSALLPGAADAAFAPAIEFLAIQKAATAAAFQSTQNAFTTRTARFIILDNFPEGVENSGGGPLYGVEFSSFPGADVLPANYGTNGTIGDVGYNVGLSGNPGGLPLYINGIPVGGIGVAGDLHDQAPNVDLRNVLETELPENLEVLVGPLHTLGESLAAYETAAFGNRVFNGQETANFDESVAMAGSVGYTAPKAIQATNIFVGGLRLPYTASPIAKGKAVEPLSTLTSDGRGSLVADSDVGKSTSTIIPGTPEQTNTTIDGVPGLYRIRSSAAAAAAGVDIQGIPLTTPPGTPFASTINSADEPITSPYSELTATDINTIIANTVAEALHTRAGIRKPNGATAKIHVVVTDPNGNVLAVFSMIDATDFSYDVAVQKARTAAYFSSSTAAFTSTAIGFLSQGHFPIGINGAAPGPLYRLQDELMDQPANLIKQTPAAGTLASTPSLPDGITDFPGGDPLYIGDTLVGGIGVSGDGVAQDDLMAYTGTAGFRPPNNIRDDVLSPAADAAELTTKLNQLANSGAFLDNFNVPTAEANLLPALKKVHLPYVKFPRNPNTL